MIIFSRNPAGVAVQLVKWYQYMAVRWQLDDSHHIQIFSVVLLDSYIICDLWSAVLQSQVIPYSGLQYFSTLSLNRHDFLKKLFCHKMYFDFLYNISMKHIYYKKRQATINQKYPQLFISKSRFSCQIYAKLEFSWQMFEKYSSTKFHEIPSMCTDGQTDLKLTVAFRNLTHLTRSLFCPFLAKHRKCQ
jgi:hypothetical protein